MDASSRLARVIYFVAAALGCLVLSRVLLSCASAETSAAVASGYGIDFWHEAEGLPESRIRAITQTNDGYIWLGTDGGAVRFNGKTFTAFTVESGSLKDNEVWALAENQEHALWIGTFGGGLTRLKDGRFQTFTTADGLPDDVVTRIEKDAAGDLWLATSSGFARYSYGQFLRIDSPDRDATAPRNTICAQASGDVFLATSSQVFRLSHGRLDPLAGLVQPGDGTIEKLTCASGGTFWAGFSNGAIKHWAGGEVTTYRPQNGPPVPVTALYQGPAGVWAALEGTIYHFREGRFERLVLDDERAPLSTVYAMYVDREGSIWVGLQSNGLARLRRKQISTLPDPPGEPDAAAQCVYQDGNGDVWVGMENAVARYRQGRLLAQFKLPAGLSGPVRSLAEDGRGRLWIAAEKDLLILDQGRFGDVPGWHPSSPVTVIYRDGQGAMWVGTDWDGLFQQAGSGFRNYRDKDGLAGNRIRALLRDRHGDLWIGTMGTGVSRFSQSRFTNYDLRDGLAGNRVYAIHEDEQGSLWFATRGGLTRLKDGRFFSFTWAAGLPVDFVYSILDDGLGNFWFSSAQGLFKTGKAELADFAAGKIRKVTPVNYGVRDGMKTRACNVGHQPIAWKTTGGAMLFSSLKGVAVVDPAGLTSNSYVPPVHIENVTVNRRKQAIDRDAVVPVGSGEVEIDYAALGYLNPEKIRYKYRLTGFDTDWVDAGDRAFAYYANLPFGSYRFHVIAGNADGQWNEEGAYYAFQLRPRFYQTRLFWGAAATAGLLLTWGFFRLRMHEMKARYSAVLEERHRISQDIHDTFTQNLAGIALQLDSLTMQLEEIPQSLKERLEEACNLTRYSLAEVRRAVGDLRSEELEREELSVALPAFASRMSINSGIEPRVRVVGTPKRLNPVKEKNLLRIFQEALTNAIKHANAQTIDVELRYEPKDLILHVQDNGRGFDAEKILPLGAGHYGLTVMRERAERIGGCFTIRSVPGQGTELRIVVPFSA